MYNFYALEAKDLCISMYFNGLIALNHILVIDFIFAPVNPKWQSQKVNLATTELDHHMKHSCSQTQKLLPIPFHFL